MAEPLLPLPLIAECDQLARVLGRAALLVVAVGEGDPAGQPYLPGAVYLDYAQLVAKAPPAGGLLPPRERLRAVFSALGLTADTHVLAYDGEMNSKATRLLWTLDAIGHAGGGSLLDGGLSAWLAAGHPTQSGPTAPVPSGYQLAQYGLAKADKDYIIAHLGDPGVVILDARSPAEFAGEDVRAARGGHIPGAVNIDWRAAIDAAQPPRLRPAAELRQLYAAAGVTPDKEVIAYCQTHHRSSHSYVVLRSLGYPRVKGYDGSWSEWGNDPDTPIEA